MHFRDRIASSANHCLSVCRISSLFSAAAPSRKKSSESRNWKEKWKWKLQSLFFSIRPPQYTATICIPAFCSCHFTILPFFFLVLLLNLFLSLAVAVTTQYVSFIVQIKQCKELTCLSVFKFSFSLLGERVFIPGIKLASMEQLMHGEKYAVLECFWCRSWCLKEIFPS